MKKIAIPLFTLLTLTAAQAANAGSDSGFYLGGSVGSAVVEAQETGIDLDDSDVGYKVFGGYNFGLVPLVDLALEASYLDFGTQTGDASGGEFTLATTGLMASGLVGVNLGPVGLFAKAGIVNWNSDFKELGGNTSDSGSDPAYGIGAKFQLGSFQLRAEYELIDIEDADIDYFSVGAAYTF
ncbi:porin family protein [Simiduia curdlanivorans]|uniref:Porin family protein n=1 Tax=Simiduia curdlanivorans TaxID=1492769 RepID=A0ABV8UYZ8_9GAMM|nr:porin family protein [Simiduia curdlanivorans]MDN3639165.1 porin family protein [Simiduia curdlanivorans]